jgi:hypothetical protein
MGSVRIREGYDDAFRDLLELGWTDGLPVIPATPERVESMLDGYPGDPDEIVGVVPPRLGELTPRVVAVNSAMAGAPADCLGLIVQVMQAILEPGFNLPAVQATTHPVGPCIIISGPIAEKLGIQSGSGCLGPTFRTNIAIGRAVRLMLMNVGGAFPGTTDRSVMGSPAKLSFCFADRSSDNPWPTIAHEHTGDPEASTITVVPTESPHNVNDHFSYTGVGVLTMIAHSLANVGSNDNYRTEATPLVILAPEHAATIARDGFSREDVRQFLSAHSTTRLDRWSWENQNGRFRNLIPKLYRQAPGSVEIPMISSADQLVLAVAGGPGKHSAVVPTFGGAHAVTVPIVNT